MFEWKLVCDTETSCYWNLILLMRNEKKKKFGNGDFNFHANVLQRVPGTYLTFPLAL